jgi:hypothetical protein
MASPAKEKVLSNKFQGNNMAVKPVKSKPTMTREEMDIVPRPLHSTYRITSNSELKEQVRELFKPGDIFTTRTDNFLAAHEMHKFRVDAIPFLVHALESHPHKEVKDRAANSLNLIRGLVWKPGFKFPADHPYAYFHFNPITHRNEFLAAYSMVTRGAARSQELHDDFLRQIEGLYKKQGKK